MAATTLRATLKRLPAKARHTTEAACRFCERGKTPGRGSVWRFEDGPAHMLCRSQARIRQDAMALLSRRMNRIINQEAE